MTAVTRTRPGGALWALAGLIAGAWALVLLAPAGMDAGLPVFVVAWTVMMTAMMLPSFAPLVLLFGRGAPLRATAALVAGYLLVWAAAGVPAWLIQMRAPAAAGPLALAVAGGWQLTSLKQSCLRHCRSPADTLMQHWGRSALRLGSEHGLWCLGCCWALMAVLVLVGAMGPAWVVGIASIVAVEKLARNGVLFSRVTGVAFLLVAAVRGGMLWLGS